MNILIKLRKTEGKRSLELQYRKNNAIIMETLTTYNEKKVKGER